MAGLPCLPLCLLLMAAGQFSPGTPDPRDPRRQTEARVATAAALRAYEQASDAAANVTEALARRRAEAQARLDARAAALQPLLPLIERMSLYPAETLLTMQVDPDRSLTGLLVLKGLARQLEAEAEALRAEQAEVARLSAALAAQEARLATAQSAQAAQAAGLDRQLDDARTQQGPEDAAALATRRAASQAARAQTLRAALNLLDLARRQDEARARADAAAAERARQDAQAAEARQRQVVLAQPAGPGLGEAHGQLGAPVVGAVTRAFGEPGESGPATGISYSPPPAARVSAPCTGRVVFAGPFRSYGQLVIVDCGGGYHFVLAGLDRLDTQAGRPVQGGEPIGVMPNWDPRSASGRPSLYLELREGDATINPAPYLRARS